MVSYFRSVWCFECSLNVRIWWVTLEALDALNVPWMLAYGQLLWKCLMHWMFLECSHRVSYFRSLWCFECSLIVCIWLVNLEAFDALNVPRMLAYGALFGSIWCFECSLNVSIWWITLEVFHALNVSWMFAYGELLWNRLMPWMFLEC